MSIDEQIQQDKVLQKTELKKQLEINLTTIERLETQLSLNQNPLFQEWIIDNVRNPFNESVSIHLNEIDTNRSFVSKGSLKAYQYILSWTSRKSEELKQLKERVSEMEKSLEDATENSHKPEE